MLNLTGLAAQFEQHMHAVLLNGLKCHYNNAEETEKNIITCAFTAATADDLGGAIPGLAVVTTIISCVGAVWVMYGKLCSCLWIKMRDNTLKLLARAALANIAGNLASVLLSMAATLLIPGGSIAASAIITFLVVYLAGLAFLQMVLNLAEKSNDPYAFSDISDGEMKRKMKETKFTAEDLEAAKQSFQENRS